MNPWKVIVALAVIVCAIAAAAALSKNDGDIRVIIGNIKPGTNANNLTELIITNASNRHYYLFWLGTQEWTTNGWKLVQRTPPKPISAYGWGLAPHSGMTTVTDFPSDRVKRRCQFRTLPSTVNWFQAWLDRTLPRGMANPFQRARIVSSPVIAP